MCSHRSQWPINKEQLQIESNSYLSPPDCNPGAVRQWLSITAVSWLRTAKVNCTSWSNRKAGKMTVSRTYTFASDHLFWWSRYDLHPRACVLKRVFSVQPTNNGQTQAANSARTDAVRAGWRRSRHEDERRRDNDTHQRVVGPLLLLCWRGRGNWRE